MPLSEFLLDDLQRYRALVYRRSQIEREIAELIAKRWALYFTPKPADEPHDENCQKHESRYGDHPGVACTCETNNIRRKQAVQAAGVANDEIIHATLGSWEMSIFAQARDQTI